MNHVISEEERALLRRFIRDGSVVFDVGANVGHWTLMALKEFPCSFVHAFEPGGNAFRELVAAVSDADREGKVTCNPLALGDQVGVAEFFEYRNKPSLNSLHRRRSVESDLELPTPSRRIVPVNTLDAYCDGLEIRHINYLKIDVEGNEYAVLKGARKLLDRRAIDYLQIEYGGAYLDAGIKLAAVFNLVADAGYSFYRLHAKQLMPVSRFMVALEDYQHALYLAVSPRLACQLSSGPPQMFNYKKLFSRHQVAPKGLLHVGAHEGEELEKYRKAGVERVLFIEGDPATYARLERKLSVESDVRCLQQLISDEAGTACFHRMTMDQSNSMLPLKMHAELYPGITEAETVDLPTKTLDATLADAGIKASEYNVLAIDVQGAELKVLRGASETLRHMDAVLTEVNYAELYKGCALIHELDDLLNAQGFLRVEETCPYDPSWGDAFYVRRPRISMTTLGSNGRFANQLFQYHFLHMVAEAKGGYIETPPWIGEVLFDLPARRPSGIYQRVSQTPSNLDPDDVINRIARHRDIDLWGYFQYHTGSWSAQRDSFRRLFSPRPDLASCLENAMGRLRRPGHTLVACHLRRGDYGNGHHFIAPEQWYTDFLDDIWPHLDRPLLYIASDDLPAVLPAFERFSPITDRELGLDLGVAQMYLDFYVQSQADVLAISNSSFSVAAALLNRLGRVFVRPERRRCKLVPFDPWNSHVLWHRE